MHPFTHSQTHRLLATSQSHSTLVQSHPRHPSQLPGGPAEHTLQLFPTGRCPLLPLGGSMSPPNTPSLQLLSLNVNGLRGKQKRAALFATLQSGPWQVIALQETHHANQTEAAQWCRERAGPTAPWDGPSFWATGTSASRGVALLFKPSPLLSGATSVAVDPNGRFVAVRCDLSGSQITIASVYAPVERQERTPFFHSSLLPALPAGTPLALGGDWNCVASDQDLIGG